MTTVMRASACETYYGPIYGHADSSSPSEVSHLANEQLVLHKLLALFLCTLPLSIFCSLSHLSTISTSCILSISSNKYRLGFLEGVQAHCRAQSRCFR